MARKLQVLLTCDMHEEDVPAVETVTFGFDGYSYDFELCQEHLDEFNNAMQGYVSAARKSDGPSTNRRRRTATTSQSHASNEAKPPRATRAAELKEIREWARANGYTVSDRGRVAGNVVEAYNRATTTG